MAFVGKPLLDIEVDENLNSDLNKRQNEMDADINSYDIIKMSFHQKSMARNTELSLKIPHFSLSDEIDVTNFYENIKMKTQKHALFVAFVRALSETLKDLPLLNSRLYIEKDEIHTIRNHNISIAIDTPTGLVAPCLKTVNKMSEEALSVKVEDLINRAKTIKFKKDDFTNSTITLSNIGSLGGQTAHPIISSPHMAVLVLGRIIRKPVVVSNQGRENTEARSMLSVTWCADHRIIDGKTLADALFIFKKKLTGCN